MLTKLDLVDEGAEEEVMCVARNIRKPLALGYVMIKNPSQKQWNDGMTPAGAREAEVAYFHSHPVFNAANEPNCLFGTPCLVQMLTKILVWFAVNMLNTYMLLLTLMLVCLYIV